MGLRNIPFAAASKMLAAIHSAIVGNAGSPLALRAALAGIPVYRSRGHGEGLLGNKHSRHRVAHDKRAARKRRNQLRAKR